MFSIIIVHWHLQCDLLILPDTAKSLHKKLYNQNQQQKLHMKIVSSDVCIKEIENKRTGRGVKVWKKHPVSCAGESDQQKKKEIKVWVPVTFLDTKKNSYQINRKQISKTENRTTDNYVQKQNGLQFKYSLMLEKILKCTAYTKPPMILSCLVFEVFLLAICNI